MKRAILLVSVAMLATSAIAQQGPESLLPPGFDRPAARPAPRPAEPRVVTPVAVPQGVTAPGVPSVVPTDGATQAPGQIVLPANLPSLDKLQAMTPDELAALLGNRPHADMPAGSRRAMKNLGVIDVSEGGMPGWSLARQNASLVRAAVAGNNGQIVSRWGHILLRRALASRLDAPAGLDAGEFLALRAGLLTRMGEGEAARALVQDADVVNYGPSLVQAALDAYVATADFTGACPMVNQHGGVRKDAQWQVLQAICAAFSSNGTRGMSQLDRIAAGDGIERIDLLLAQKYAGAAGRAQRAVTIEWDGVSAMTPWRYGMTLAVGLEPPQGLGGGNARALDLMTATLPMASLTTRTAVSDIAGATGILSSSAMVDLYSQLFASGSTGEWADRSVQLQSAYLATSPADRLVAIKNLWGDAGGDQYYGRQVLTAYAAARMPVESGMADDAPGLIASMLTAGLDSNALRWGGVVPSGSLGWALLALAEPVRSGRVSGDPIDQFHSADKSESQRKTQFLIAGLAGLGRIDPGAATGMAQKYEFVLDRPTRWTQLIDKAAEVGNPTLVALFAGLGMQGSGWDKMTPRNLFHIVAALNRVGLSAEARMIAAEAVARG